MRRDGSLGLLPSGLCAKFTIKLVFLRRRIVASKFEIQIKVSFEDSFWHSDQVSQSFAFLKRHDVLHQCEDTHVMSMYLEQSTSSGTQANSLTNLQQTNSS